MLKVTMPNFEDLTDDERDIVSNNGGGKEYAEYIKVMYGDETILLENDAMEPEDARFSRDLSWIGPIIEKAYKLGQRTKD